ncbi:ion-transporting P-type ATPase [Paratrimastix pyriformis]|uniref:Cation-transporting ATPase n=1 Tax=Paratrimastix pyriformis TaxID=342808 RepID=A0ABQ8UPB3_9EUKA|nr:ion-transporting P-type ATPase [Paratrimastix pyriformis]
MNSSIPLPVSLFVRLSCEFPAGVGRAEAGAIKLDRAFQTRRNSVCMEQDQHGGPQSKGTHRDNVPADPLAKERGDEKPADDLNLDYFKETIGYTPSICRSFFFVLGCILTCGLMLLLVQWFPVFLVRGTCKKCPINRAKKVLMRDQYNNSYICPIEKIHDGEHEVTMITYKMFRYVLEGGRFVPVTFNAALSYPHIRNIMSLGVDTKLYRTRMAYFGKNSIEIPIPPAWKTLKDEALHPFFIFQIWSIIVWALDDYYSYASCILVISVLSIISTFISSRRTMANLHAMSKFVSEIRVRRQGEEVHAVNASDIIPGDVVELTDGMNVPCDVLLISGQCILNESMLTGESVPVIKNPLPYSEDENETLDPLDKGMILFGGTKVIQARPTTQGSPVLGIAIRTGFATAKGALLRSMMFPKPSSFRFYQDRSVSRTPATCPQGLRRLAHHSSDPFKFVGTLALVALCGFAVSSVSFITYHVPVKEIILRACDLITVVVPPALPAAMTIGTAIAQTRLKKGNIFCISSQRINVSGKLRVMCFDKTGTLTEEGLDVLGVRSATLVQNEGLSEALRQDMGPAFNPLVTNCQQYQPYEQPLVHALASCHSPTSHRDPVLASRAPFSSPLPSTPPHMRCGTRTAPATSVSCADSPAAALRQGSPEIVSSLCCPNTIPTSFKAVTSEYTNRGYRVIAWRGAPSMASLASLWSVAVSHIVHRPDRSSHLLRFLLPVLSLLPASTSPERIARTEIVSSRDPFSPSSPALSLLAERIARSEIEHSLHFLGLLIMENRLRPQSRPTIERLTAAQIRSLMVTGDNALTGVNVAKGCGLIPVEMPVYLGDLTKLSGPTSPPEQTLDPVTLQPRPLGLVVSPSCPPTTASAPPSLFPSSNGTAFAPHPTPFTPTPVGLLHPSLNDDDLTPPRSPSPSPPPSPSAASTPLLGRSSDWPGFSPKLKHTHTKHFLGSELFGDYRLAITGPAFGHLLKTCDPKDDASTYRRMLLMTPVFARMSPDHKTRLVESLIDMGFCTGMCGDGGLSAEPACITTLCVSV